MSSIAAGNFSPADDGDQLSRSCSLHSYFAVIGIKVSAPTAGPASRKSPNASPVDDLIWMGSQLIAVTHGRGLYSIVANAPWPVPRVLHSPVAVQIGANVDVLYRDENNHMSDIYGATRWSWQDLTTAGVPAAVGDPYAINYGAVRNMTHVLFCGEDYQLAYLYYDTKWNYQDLTTAVPRLTSVAFEGKPFAIVYGRLSRLYVYCRDYDHQLWELVFDGGSWQATDLLQEPPTWTGPQVYGDPRAVEFNGILHLFYRDVSNHIWHVYRGVQKWTAEDVTQAVSGPLPRSNRGHIERQRAARGLSRRQRSRIGLVVRTELELARPDRARHLSDRSRNRGRAGPTL